MQDKAQEGRKRYNHVNGDRRGLLFHVITAITMIAAFNSNKNPSFFDKLPTERGENAYITHPAKRRSASGSRLVVYPSREKTLFLTDLAKPYKSISSAQRST